jgi:hypothetical protein
LLSSALINMYLACLGEHHLEVVCTNVQSVMMFVLYVVCTLLDW